MRKLRQEEVSVGRRLGADVRTQDGVLLLRRGQVVESEPLAARLLADGFVTAPSVPAPRGRVAPARPVAAAPDAEDKTRAMLLDIDGIFEDMEQLFVRVAPGSNVPDRVRHLARQIIAACRKDADASLASIFLAVRRLRRYVVRHPLNVAIVVNTLLDNHPIEAAERESITCAALTMNIAMTDLQERLLAQREPLTAEQKEMVRKHPEIGVEILRLLGVKDDIWLRCVLEHHEDLEGGGYPQGRREHELLLGSRLIMFADNFCARISPRDYREGLTAREALRSLFLHGGHIVRGEQAGAYIRYIGIYPPGCYVRLANGETAIVHRRGESANCPDVFSILDKARMPLAEPLRRDTSDKRYAVVEALSDAEAGTTFNPWHLLP